MQEKELQILNLALDGKKVHGFTLDENTVFSRQMIQTIKVSMIQKGLLVNEKELTPFGTETALKLMQYKQAYKYIHVCNMIIGCCKDRSGIVLLREEDGECSLQREPLQHIWEFIERKFHTIFLGEEEKTEPEQQERLSFDVLLRKYEVIRDNSLYVTEEKSDRYKRSYIFFADARRKYFYNMDTGNLHKVSARVLHERFIKLCDE